MAASHCPVCDADLAAEGFTADRDRILSALRTPSEKLVEEVARALYNRIAARPLNAPYPHFSGLSQRQRDIVMDDARAAIAALSSALAKEGSDGT